MNVIAHLPWGLFAGLALCGALAAFFATRGGRQTGYHPQRHHHDDCH